jgi:N-acylneuraminate cytidylyltransferase
MLEYAENNDDFSTIILIQATSPMLTAHHIDDALSKFKGSQLDSIVGLVRQKKFIWDIVPDGTVEPRNYDPRHRPRSQDFSGILTEPGALYITSRQSLLTSRCRISGRIGSHELPDEFYFDIDTPFDWDIMEYIMRKTNRAQITAGEA